jgi:hypothetical protein
MGAELRSKPFAEHAVELARLGLAVIPLGGADGKKPLVNFKNLHRPMGPEAVAELIEKLDKSDEGYHANIGLLTDLSRLSLFDLDEGGKSTLNEGLTRFGNTPAIVRTPRPGWHLYFKSSGERNMSLDRFGIKGDLKGAARGYAVVPPSIRPIDGAPYEFFVGSFDVFRNLPTAKPLLQIEEEQAGVAAAFKLGNRNKALFGRAMREAKYCADRDALLNILMGLNQQMEAPLPVEEVCKMATHVWNDYKEKDRLWFGREARAVRPRAATDLLLRHPNGGDGAILHDVLLQEHGARHHRGERFAIAPKAMAAGGRLSCWEWKRIMRARDALLECGLILRVHKGGRRKGDAGQFCFG